MCDPSQSPEAAFKPRIAGIQVVPKDRIHSIKGDFRERFCSIGISLCGNGWGHHGAPDHNAQDQALECHY